MAIPQMLDALLRVPGPSGQEAVRRPRGATVAPFAAEVGVDVMGRPGPACPGTGPAAADPSLAVVGHIDEIGVHITHIDDDGFLRFGQVGGWDPVNLVSQRVLLDTATVPSAA